MSILNTPFVSFPAPTMCNLFPFKLRILNHFFVQYVSIRRPGDRNLPLTVRSKFSSFFIDFPTFFHAFFVIYRVGINRVREIFAARSNSLFCSLFMIFRPFQIAFSTSAERVDQILETH